MTTINELPQEFTSAKTSINKNKVPALFKLAVFKPDTVNLDYGGGKFDTATEYLKKFNVTNLIYDPYNRTKEHNNSVIEQINENHGADSVTCSNVLNVIKEYEVRQQVLENIKKLVKTNGIVYITVYVGNGTGIGSKTTSGYQLNRRTEEYVEEIKKVFPIVERKGRLIVAIK